MLVAIRVFRDFAVDTTSLLAHPFQGRNPNGTDDYKPRRDQTVLLLGTIMASEDLTTRGPVELAFDLQPVGREWLGRAGQRTVTCGSVPSILMPNVAQSILASRLTPHTVPWSSPAAGHPVDGVDAGGTGDLSGIGTVSLTTLQTV
jgi:hypothetical protein